jgi:hypothetical protein
MDNERDILAKEIRTFLRCHATVRLGYNPDTEDEFEMYDKSDAVEMLKAAVMLEEGLRPDYPFTTWCSGCYVPLTDLSARNWHDDLVERVKAYIYK